MSDEREREQDQETAGAPAGPSARAFEQTLERTLAAARRAAPAWNPRRQQQLSWSVRARLEAPPRGRRLAALAGAAALVAVGVFAWRQLSLTHGSTARAPQAAATATSPVRLADGTRIDMDGPSTILTKTVEAADDVQFDLEAGGARFEVARRPTRTFRVHAGAVTVQVIGTRFRVERHASSARVSVDRGRVLVSWWGGSRELGAGEIGTFPPARTTDTTAALVPVPVPVPVPAEVAPTPLPTPITSTPAAHAQPLGKHAHASLARVAAPSAGPDVLFARADRARAAGDHAAAIGYLREIVQLYPSDPHAPMAAFTVGRLLLESEHEPAQAAVSFARARALAKDGPLGEDALAREVEALHAAGDRAGARARAELYQQRYPNGVRLHAVMRLGGLQALP